MLITRFCIVISSFLDVGFDHDGVLGPRQLLEGRECGQRALRVLLAVAAGEPDAADHFAVEHYRKAADEGRESALEAELDAERLVTRQRRPVRRRGEEMRRALVAGGREGLVAGPLRTRDARAVHAVQRVRVAAVIDDANGL